MSSKEQVVRALANSLLAGPVTAKDFSIRVAETLGGKARWMPTFSRRVFELFGSRLGDNDRPRLMAFIRADKGFLNAWTAPNRLQIRRYFVVPSSMEPRPAALAGLALPVLSTPGDLAAWLGVETPKLYWLADPQGRIRVSEGPLSHYCYRWIPKRHGQFRLMEVPKSGLRAIQRRILREILDPVPAHRAAHGFRRGHSCRSFAEPHAGKPVVLRMDLRNFFISIPRSRVTALFNKLGYPPAVATLLACLCTNGVPVEFLQVAPAADPVSRLSWEERKQLADRHLPQGAPTSPALANLCALHLDFRLAGLAEALGGNYTRYADDLALSGGEAFRRKADNLDVFIGAIALEEGFELNHRKTWVMHRSDRQRLTGIVVNDKINVQRTVFDELKATLHNCVRFGPASQNRESAPDFRARLRGRISHVTGLNAERGAKLISLFERIDWHVPNSRDRRGGVGEVQS